MATPTYTRGEWSIAVTNAILHGTGAASGAGAVDVIVGWTVAETSTQEAQTVHYNLLNMKNGADIAVWKPQTLSNGIVTFPTFADGVNATAHRLLGNPAYSAIVQGIKSNSLNPRELSSDTAVQAALGVWVNGPHGGPISQSYVANIIAGSGANNDVLPGVDGDTTISNQSATGDNLGGSFSTTGPSFTSTQVVKVLGGALMILAGVALLIKSLGVSSVARVLTK